MAVDLIKLTPDSFLTIYLRREDRVILRTEQGRKIVIKRIIPEEWKPWRIWDNEHAINENKREIYLFDNRYLPQMVREFKTKIRSNT